MSERIPSCMRAPPEAVTQTSGTCRSAARSQARANFSPTALPIEPPMNAKSMTASSHGLRSIAARARDDRVAEPRRHLGLGDALGVGAQVEEAERVGRAKVRVLLLERAPVGELLDPPARPHGEVVPAVRADPERRLELVVPVVGVAARAGVRVRFRSVRLGPAVLDRYVDAARHDGLSYGFAAAHKPEGASRPRAGRATFAGSATSP